MHHHRRYIIMIVLAVLATLPGFFIRFSGMAARILPEHIPGHKLIVSSTLPDLLLVTILSGIAILGASFLLLWACDVVQMDVSQTLALAVVALIAVLPEYAVDMYFTWQAGQVAGGGDYAHYAIANMTGANRLLIGVAWVVIVFIFWLKTRRAVRLEQDRRTELAFLGMATLYAFIIPIKGSLTWYDGLVFLGLYVWYIILAGRRPTVECEAEGPAEMLCALPTGKRRAVTVGMFLFAMVAILANAMPFSEGLVASGTKMQINEFLLVQWLAPIASEAPEFIVCIMFALRGQAGMALGSLLSSKLNQWTLLVGMIPGVYAVSSKSLASPIPMDSLQMHEILLTAAQSLLAVILLTRLRLSIWQGALLFGLFIGQFVVPMLVEYVPILHSLGISGTAEQQGDAIHQIFSLIYIALAIGLLLDDPRRVKGLQEGLRPTPVSCPITMNSPDPLVDDEDECEVEGMGSVRREDTSNPIR